jgi:hypothetical protein
MENSNLNNTGILENEIGSESFDGLTPEEREKIKALGIQALENYQKAVKGYKNIFEISKKEKPQ